jgi:GTP-binding protein Era
MSRAGFVALVGITSVGKSSLINAMLGEKIAMVSGKPQATRKSMNVILSDEESQVIFVDTPGLHTPRNKLGEYMARTVARALKGADRIIFLTQMGKKLHFPRELEGIFSLQKPIDLIITKVDTKGADFVSPEIPDDFKFDNIFQTSVVTGQGIEELKQHLMSSMPPGPFLYPEDDLTDVTARFIVEEFIREVVCQQLEDELPFGVAVKVEEYREQEKGKLFILADIFCERDSHKGMIIGKNGKMIRLLGEKSRQLVETFMQTDVYIELKVKVRKNWRKREEFLRYFGYHD